MSSAEQLSGAHPKSQNVPEVQAQLERNLRSDFGDGTLASGAKIEFLQSHAWREYGLTIGLAPLQGIEIFRKLKEDPKYRFDMLIDVTAVDWLDRREPRFDVVYQLLSLSHLHRLQIKIAVPEEKPEVDSLRPLWHSANFLEREVWDMYGVSFRGHGDQRRILMYEEFQGHPLRKDYPLRGKQPRVPLRIPELRNTSADMRRDPLVSLPVRPGSGAKSPRKSVG